MKIANKNLQEIGEFGLIDRIKNWMGLSSPEVLRGIGDDVAVIHQGKKALLVTTDILIEDIHFERSWIDPYHLGRKALAVNLSDIAAMGGIPKYFLISMGLPKNLSLSFVSLLYRGLKEEAKRFQVDLIGGDTSLSKKMIINVCLIGEGKSNTLLYRNGAKIGDDLYVSGTLGDSALGLKLLQDKRIKRKPKRLIEKHLIPRPRIELGQTLAQNHLASSMIDVSDGLLGDVLHLLEESRVGARIWKEYIPLSRSYQRWVQTYSEDPYELALVGGEDYELLFTASPQKRERIFSLSRSLRIAISRIGEIVKKTEGFRLIGKADESVPLNQGGFDHFK